MIKEIEITPRQQEVFECLVEGNTNQEIAEILKINRRTVETHVSALLASTETASRQKLISKYLQGKVKVSVRKWEIKKAEIIEYLRTKHSPKFIAWKLQCSLGYILELRKQTGL